TSLCPGQNSGTERPGLAVYSAGGSDVRLWRYGKDGARSRSGLSHYVPTSARRICPGGRAMAGGDDGSESLRRRYLGLSGVILIRGSPFPAREALFVVGAAHEPPPVVQHPMLEERQQVELATVPVGAAVRGRAACVHSPLPQQISPG